MAVMVKNISLWRKEVDNQVGTLAHTLEPVTKAGVNLQILMGYRYPGEGTRAAIELYPCGSSKCQHGITDQNQAVGAVPFYLLLAGRPSTKIEPWLPLPVQCWLTCGRFFCHVRNSPWKPSLFASNSLSSSGSSPGPNWVASIGCSGLSSAGYGRAGPKP